jgi:hypothetical protein
VHVVTPLWGKRSGETLRICAVGVRGTGGCDDE